MKLKTTLFTLTLVILASCGFNASKYYTPLEANATKAKISVSELVSAREKYINTCGECHRLYKPSRNSASDWKMYLDNMQERAEISDKEKNNIYLYLTSEISE